MRISLIDQLMKPARRFKHRPAFTFLLVLTVLTGLVFPTVAMAQVAADETAPDKAQPQDQPITARTHPNEPELWNADQMMEEAAKQIARRYNLNKAQENFTRMLLRERTLAFLDEYETDVRELLKESIDFRLGLKPATPEALQDWASRALPVYEAAKNAILDGNEEWREILDPGQIKIHDADLAMMKANFGQVTNMLTDWEEGKGAFGRQTRTQTIKSSGEPDETTGEVSQPREPNQSVVERRRTEENWLAYVNKFIRVYDLNEEKANAARAGIHKEQLSKAYAYRGKHKIKFDKLEAEIMAPPKEGQEAKQTRRLQKQLAEREAELERPIRILFVEMDRRLRELPTTAQLASVDPAEKKELDEWYDMLAGDAAPEGKRAEEKPSSTSQPASSQPAASEDKPADKPEEEKPEETPKAEAAPITPTTTAPAAEEKPDAKAENPPPAKADDKPAAAPVPEKKTSDAPAKPAELVKEAAKSGPENSGKGPQKKEHEQ